MVVLAYVVTGALLGASLFFAGLYLGWRLSGSNWPAKLPRAVGKQHGKE